MEEFLKQNHLDLVSLKENEKNKENINPNKLQSIITIQDRDIRNRFLRATIQNTKKDIQNHLLLQEYIKRVIQHKKLQTSLQDNQSSIKEEILRSINLKYKTQFTEKVQDLVGAKEQNFQLYEQIEDTKYELLQCKRVLRYLNGQLQEREKQIAKLFSDINNLTKHKNQFAKFKDYLKNLKLPNKIIGRPSQSCNQLNQTMDSNRMKMCYKGISTEIQEIEPEKVNVSLRSTTQIQQRNSKCFYP